MKVLVVDDSKAVHAFVEGIFEGLGHNLSHVYDGSEAVSNLENKNNSYDVILLDWEMPILTGPETLLKIRQMSITTPIIMVTTKNDLTSISKALENGADEYVMKPFTKDILLEKIENLLATKVV